MDNWPRLIDRLDDYDPFRANRFRPFDLDSELSLEDKLLASGKLPPPIGQALRCALVFPRGYGNQSVTKKSNGVSVACVPGCENSAKVVVKVLQQAVDQVSPPRCAVIIAAKYKLEGDNLIMYTMNRDGLTFCTVASLLVDYEDKEADAAVHWAKAALRRLAYDFEKRKNRQTQPVDPMERRLFGLTKVFSDWDKQQEDEARLDANATKDATSPASIVRKVLVDFCKRYCSWDRDAIGPLTPSSTTGFQGPSQAATHPVLPRSRAQEAPIHRLNSGQLEKFGQLAKKNKGVFLPRTTSILLNRRMPRPAGMQQQPSPGASQVGSDWDDLSSQCSQEIEVFFV